MMPNQEHECDYLPTTFQWFLKYEYFKNSTKVLLKYPIPNLNILKIIQANQYLPCDPKFHYAKNEILFI